MTLKHQISPNYIKQLHNVLPPQEVEQFVDVCFKPLKKSIRFVLHKWDVDELKNFLQGQGWHFADPGFLQDSRFPQDIFYVDRDDTTIPLGNTFVHKAGYIYIQEVAAALAVRALDLKKWARVLDMSAAPWWKATQIADYLLYLDDQNPWFVVANDVAKPRIKKMAYNVNRIGAYNIGLTAFNWFAFGKNLPEFFDYVLLDAPCSGEGTGYKSATALKFWKQEEINKIKGTQFQLLVSALKTLKVWWELVYSTCTLNPYENEMNVANILEQYWDFIKLQDIQRIDVDKGISHIWEQQILDPVQAQKLRRLRPHRQGSWWFFIARFQKVGSNTREYAHFENKFVSKNPFRLDFSQSLQSRVKDWLKQNYWIQINQWVFFVASKELIYITSSQILQIKDHINFEKIGIPIIKRTRWYVRPTHHLGNILWAQATKNVVQIDAQQAQDYALGKNLPNDFNQSFDTDYIILNWQGRWFSVAKVIGDILKNKMIS